jgi:hypothetical protein
MKITKIGLIGLLGLAMSSFMWDADAGELSLLQIHKILAGKKFIDLTHAFAPGIPHWHGFPDEKRDTIYWYEKGRGTRHTSFADCEPLIRFLCKKWFCRWS